MSTRNGSHTPAARAEGATKIYWQGDAEVRAIDGIDVEFGPGAFTAIMGPSGSGKSTGWTIPPRQPRSPSAWRW